MLRDKVRRQQKGRALAKGSVPACAGLTIDIKAEYDKGAQNVPPSLSMSWTVNGVETARFVQSALFGFIIDEAANYVAGGSVEYGAHQSAFGGYLEVPWTLSVPTAASMAYLRLYIIDSAGSQTECGTEVPISTLP